MPNRLLSGAIAKYLQERGELLPLKVNDYTKQNEPCATCNSHQADILLMETGPLPFFTLSRRLETAEQVRKNLPHCKIVLLCDEKANPDTAEKVKDAKKMGLIDGFFYSSVSGEYLAAMLDSL